MYDNSCAARSHTVGNKKPETCEKELQFKTRTEFGFFPMFVTGSISNQQSWRGVLERLRSILRTPPRSWRAPWCKPPQKVSSTWSLWPSGHESGYFWIIQDFIPISFWMTSFQWSVHILADSRAHGAKLKLDSTSTWKRRLFWTRQQTNLGKQHHTFQQWRKHVFRCNVCLHYVSTFKTSNKTPDWLKTLPFLVARSKSSNWHVLSSHDTH